MPERDDHDEQSVVFDGVENTVVAHPNAVPLTTPQRFRPGRSGVYGQKRDRTSNACLVLPVYAFEGSQSSWANVDFIGHEMPSPAEIGLDLIPRDVRTLFGHSSIECLNVFDFFCRLHQAVVLGEADHDRLGLTTALDEDSLALGSLDDRGEALAGLRGSDTQHASIVQRKSRNVHDLLVLLQHDRQFRSARGSPYSPTVSRPGGVNAAWARNRRA